MLIDTLEEAFVVCDDADRPVGLKEFLRIARGREQAGLTKQEKMVRTVFMSAGTTMVLLTMLALLLVDAFSSPLGWLAAMMLTAGFYGACWLNTNIYVTNYAIVHDLPLGEPDGLGNYPGTAKTNRAGYLPAN